MRVRDDGARIHGENPDGTPVERKRVALVVKATGEVINVSEHAPDCCAECAAWKPVDFEEKDPAKQREILALECGPEVGIGWAYRRGAFSPPDGSLTAAP